MAVDILIGNGGLICFRPAAPLPRHPQKLGCTHGQRAHPILWAGPVPLARVSAAFGVFKAANAPPRFRMGRSRRSRLTKKWDAPIAKAAGRSERRPSGACGKSQFRGRLGRTAIRDRLGPPRRNGAAGRNPGTGGLLRRRRVLRAEAAHEALIDATFGTAQVPDSGGFQA